MLGLGLSIPAVAVRQAGGSSLAALIASLYGNGEQGAFYVPKPVVLGQQVLFQDAAGTTPVTADGDPVGLMLDLSGNDNHAMQEVSGSRPVYRTDGTRHWLEFDGVDDALVTTLDAAQGNADRAIFITADSPEGAPAKYRHWVHSGQPTSGKAFGLVYRVSGQQTSRDGYYLGNHYWNSGYSADFSSLGKDVYSVVKNGDTEDYYRYSTGQHNTNTRTTATASGVYRIFQITTGTTAEIGKGNMYGLVIVHDGLGPSKVGNIQEYLASVGGVTLNV